MKLNFGDMSLGDTGERKELKRCGCEVGYRCCCEVGPESNADDLVTKMSRNEKFFRMGHSWWEHEIDEEEVK